MMVSPSISSWVGLISTIVKHSISVRVWEAWVFRVGVTVKSYSAQRAR